MKTAPVALLLALATGCAFGDVPADEDPGQDPVDPVAGQYELTSSYDLTSSEAAPGFLGDVVGPLANLREAPGATVLEILEGTSGGLADLLDLLGSDVRAQLEAKIDEVVQKELDAGSTAGDVIVWIDEAAQILSDFEIISRFELGRPDELGVANANHSLSAVRFELGGERRTIDTPEIIDTLTIARDVECDVDEAAGEIEISEHAFHLPLGDLLVTGINKALESSVGAKNLAEALAVAIDCADIASKVGEQCIGQLCITEANLTDLCNQGLTTVANEIEQAVSSIDFAELRMSGTAKLEAKADASQPIDQWNRGSWASAFEIDGLVIPVDAAFSATRL